MKVCNISKMTNRMLKQVNEKLDELEYGDTEDQELYDAMLALHSAIEHVVHVCNEGDEVSDDEIEDLSAECWG